MFGTTPHVFDERTDYNPVQGLQWKWFEKHKVISKGKTMIAELMPHGHIYLSYDGRVVKTDAKLGVDFNLIP